MNLDKEYQKALADTHLLLAKSYDILINQELSLTDLDYSKYLLERIKLYYTAQYNNKIFLEKGYITNGADYFTEQILFFIRIFLEKEYPTLKVVSEKAIKPKRGSIRPDISIWLNNEVIAIIECKTQLGWNRNKWEADFLLREKKLKKEYKNAKAFLIVLTALNWKGFENNEFLGTKYFCLLKDKWGSNYENKDDIFTPFERLLKELRKL